ncbi:MAG: prepilin-type N-terminal cleavage/methylation domain-containing protein [Cryobacterium sp.]|nr:prepilin-type N-terminal cleavage/methylation domain-containing protein [Oligoflexia bacterium]
MAKNRQTLIRNASGFSLIELLVVVALMGLIGTMAIPSISNVFKISLGSTARDLATTVRYSYNAAMMTKKVHRLVFDLKENRYWVEVGPQTMLMDTEASRSKAERAKRFGQKDDEAEKKKDSGFSLASYVTRKKNDLPRGVVFVDVKTEQMKEPITDGFAYTHFFPHGIIEQTVIHLKDTSNHQATLVVAPIVGRTRVIERYLPADEALLEP